MPWTPRAADPASGGGQSIAGAGADDQGDRAFLVAWFRDRPHAGRHVGDDLLAPHGMGVEQQEPSSSGLNDSCRHHLYQSGRTGGVGQLTTVSNRRCDAPI